MAKALQQARVLIALAAHGIAADQIIEASPSVIKVLAADGAVDPHKDAVAYAKKQGAEVVRLRDDDDGSDADTQARLAELQQTLAAATADDEKAALQAQIDQLAAK